MGLLIDTNVFLDIYLHREGHVSAEALFTHAIRNLVTLYVSSSAVTDIFYIARKQSRSIERAYEILDEIISIADILTVTSRDIIQAREMRWKDFEDAVQMTVAKRNGSDAIITNNVSDFEEADILVMTPSQYISCISDEI